MIENKRLYDLAKNPFIIKITSGKTNTFAKIRFENLAFDVVFIGFVNITNHGIYNKSGSAFSRSLFNYFQNLVNFSSLLFATILFFHFLQIWQRCRENHNLFLIISAVFSYIYKANKINLKG